MTNPFGAPAAPTGTVHPTMGYPGQPDPFGAQRPAQPAASPIPQQQPDGADPFGGPAPQALRPRIRDLEGRLLLIIPQKIQRGLISKNLKNPDGTPVVQDRLTADVIVLDGGPVHYGGSPEALQTSQRKPHDKVADVPWRIPGMWINNVGLLSQTSEAMANVERQRSGATLPPGAVTMVLGRLYQADPVNQPQGSWLVSQPTDDEKALARGWLRANPRDPFGA